MCFSLHIFVHLSKAFDFNTFLLLTACVDVYIFFNSTENSCLLSVLPGGMALGFSTLTLAPKVGDSSLGSSLSSDTGCVTSDMLISPPTVSWPVKQCNNYTYLIDG